jgi:hypothetical protein
MLSAVGMANKHTVLVDVEHHGTRESPGSRPITSTSASGRPTLASTPAQSAISYPLLVEKPRTPAINRRALNHHRD